MLKKSSELLSSFIEREREVLAGFEMPHMPTLGEGYEAITRDALKNDYAIPPNLELDVVSGFISVRGKVVAPQIDCMLVHGKGSRYGRTGKYFYDIDQVLCILEVKKTLRKADIDDAINHLLKIRHAFAENFEYKLENENYIPDIYHARKHFAQITGREAPEHFSQINQLSKEDGVLFYCLVQEMLAPLSIIHGYDGYKTEAGLRDAFVTILEEKFNSGVQGYGIPSIPSLVTSNQYCLIKTGGTPFVVSNDTNEWIPVVSTRYNTAELILELVWGKIAYQFDMEMPWDDGVYMNNISPLLLASVKKEGDRIGWKYNSIDYNEGQLERDDDNTWAPEYLNEACLSIVRILSFNGGEFEVSDDNRVYYKEKYNVDLDGEIANLVKTKYFMTNGSYLKPINSNNLILTIDDGTAFIANDQARFDKWCEINNFKQNYMRLIIA